MLFEEALKLYNEKKYEEALISFENVVGLEPKKYMGDNFEKAWQWPRPLPVRHPSARTSRRAQAAPALWELFFYFLLVMGRHDPEADAARSRR